MTAALPAPWYATPNIHLCTIADFRDLAADLGLTIEATVFLREGNPSGTSLPNILADQAVIVLTRRP